MIKGEKISVIIPAHNEADLIGKTLDNLKQDWIDELIVVNDGSTDKTAEIVKKYPVKLIDLKENQGKGGAVTEGIKYSTGDILLMLDADLGKSIKELKKLVDPFFIDDCQVTIGILPIKGGGLGFVRRLADTGLKIITGKTMKSPLSGQRAFRREVLKYILPFRKGFALEMGMNIDIIMNNIKYSEVECSFQHRVTGQDIRGYIHRIKQFKDILRYLWGLKTGKYAR